MIFVHLWLTPEGIPISVWARPRSVACFCFAAWCLWCPCVWSSLMFKLLPTQPPCSNLHPPSIPLAVIRIIIVQFICCFIVEVLYDQFDASFSPNPCHRPTIHPHPSEVSVSKLVWISCFHVFVLLLMSIDEFQFIVTSIMFVIYVQSHPHLSTPSRPFPSLIWHFHYAYFDYNIYLGKLQRPHCDLTGIMVNKRNHPKMALFQVSELL